MLNNKTKCTARVKRFLREEQDQCLILSGEVGCGKTYAAMAFYIEKGYGIFIDATELYGLYDMRYKSEKFDELCGSRIMTSRVLIIDDLGAEPDNNQGYYAFLDMLINKRYADMLTTLITTNLNKKDFKARYPDRIYDRIREWGNFFETPEKSRRGRKE